MTRSRSPIRKWRREWASHRGETSQQRSSRWFYFPLMKMFQQLRLLTISKYFSLWASKKIILAMSSGAAFIKTRERQKRKQLVKISFHPPIWQTCGDAAGWLSRTSTFAQKCGGSLTMTLSWNELPTSQKSSCVSINNWHTHTYTNTHKHKRRNHPRLCHQIVGGASRLRDVIQDRVKHTQSDQRRRHTAGVWKSLPSSVRKKLKITNK